jgi:hypothetical protein
VPVTGIGSIVSGERVTVTDADVPQDGYRHF